MNSLRELKERFHRLARQYHPDLPTGDQGKMQELNRAWETVKRIKGNSQKWSITLKPSPFYGIWMALL